MNKLLENLNPAGLLLTIAFMLILMSPFQADAQSAVVDFEPDTLFSEENFLPGDTSIGTVTITNQSEQPRKTYLAAANEFDGGLGDLLDITISDQTTTFYTGTLAQFFSQGLVELSELDAGNSVTYTLQVDFQNTDDNSTQGNTIGFDICAGFIGGISICGDTPSSTHGDGHYGGYFGKKLRIFNERITHIDKFKQTAVVEWQTNHPAMSRVVYGPFGSYNLNAEESPHYGYPWFTPEDTNKSTHHRVTLTNLIPGKQYVFRVVSRASPATISQEHLLTFDDTSPNATSATLVKNVRSAQGDPQGTSFDGGFVHGTSTDNQGVLIAQADTESESSAIEESADPATTFTEGTKTLLTIVLWIVILLPLFLIVVWLGKRGKE